MSFHNRAARYCIAFGALLVALLIAGCKSDSRKATDAAYAYMNAIKSGNVEAIKATVTKESVQQWSDQMNKSATSQSGNLDFTIGEAVITDNTALVSVTMKDAKGVEQVMKLKERKEDDRWLVYAMVVSGNGLDFTLDFEHPEQMLGEMMKGLGQSLGSAMKGFQQGMQQGMQGMQQGLQGMAPGAKH